MQRLDPHSLWRQVRGSLADAPVPIRLALASEHSIERRTALDRLAGFIATRIGWDEEADADEHEALPLFPELLGEDHEPEHPIMNHVIEKAPSFGRWLLDQRHRDDAIGALAKQAHADPAFPRDGTAKAVSARLNAIGAEGDTHQALEDAELDWLAL